jgi:hypothetical protein
LDLQTALAQTQPSGLLDGSSPFGLLPNCRLHGGRRGFFAQKWLYRRNNAINVGFKKNFSWFNQRPEDKW